MKFLQSTPGRMGAFDTQSRSQRDKAPRIARALMILITSFIAFSIIWSATTEMRVLVRAEGNITPLGELRSVDHFDGGVVTDIFVEAGSVVVANQPLARVEDPVLEDKVRELEAELAFLNKEISDIVWLLEGGAARGVSRSKEAERDLFIARQQMMKHRAKRLVEAMKIAAALRENAREQLSLSESSLERLQFLYDRGVVSQSNLLMQAEESASIRADFFRADANYSQAKLDASEANTVREESYLAFQEQHLAAINDLERSRSLAQLKLEGLMAQKERQVVRAPESGAIQSSFVTTIGEVVPSGETLFELLPSERRLVAVAKIDPKDVGHVRVGSSVVLKVTTFDTRRYGEIQGSIELISPTSIVLDNAAAYYRAVISLESSTVGEGANERPLRAGMTLNAEIEASKRTVLDYLLKPIQNAFGRSLAER